MITSRGTHRAPRTAETGLRRALLLTAASAVLPGLAHLRSGRRVTGTILLSGYVCAIVAVVLTAVALRGDLVQLAVRSDLLLALMVASGAIAIGWPVLLVWSYRVARPARISRGARALTAIIVAGLCTLAAAPPLAVARYSYVQRDLVRTVFRDPAPSKLVVGTHPQPGTGSLPRRLNVLLLGGDADVHRPGVRTDSMTLASVDTRTGTTVLISLPRNLQQVPVWDGHRKVTGFPREELLNEVYEYGHSHPHLTPGRNPGAQLLKRTYGHIVGLPVHYYAMVDMRSFRQIVDAVHGVRVCVRKAIPVPREQVAAGVIRPGCQRLSGRQALWYGRSRTGSDDYARMARQKCLIWALYRQADPMTVFRAFRRLAEVFKYSVNTDIPLGMLPSLVGLVSKIRGAGLHSIQFVPPLIRSAHPDYGRIRSLTVQALTKATDQPKTEMLGQKCG